MNRKTITFSVNRRWRTTELSRFCEAAATLYGICLVQSESERDEDCHHILLEWDKSTEIVLAYRKANDADYTDGHLVIDTVCLHPRGLIALRGWRSPIERLCRVVSEVSRYTSAKKQTQAAKRRLPQTKLLTRPARRRLVAIVLTCVADLRTLGAVVCCVGPRGRPDEKGRPAGTTRTEKTQ